jgi:predicted anti-sigma-YlaC factor YlaD
MYSRLRDLIRKIAQTQDEEISCSECLDLVSRYVDLELAGENAGQEMPQVKLHLDQCQVCQEEYELLRELARMYAQGDSLL